MSALILDINSHQLFRWDLSNKTFTPERHLSQKASHDIEKEIAALNELTSFPSTGWQFDSKDCLSYRNRNLRRSMINPPACRYPSFTTFRELSSAFASVTSIRLYIDISRYLNQSSLKELKKTQSHRSVRESFTFRRAERIIELKVSLVSTVKETIEYMREQVEKDYNISIVPLNSNNEFTFKVRGRKEYFIGNYPMLVYRSIRNSLRGMQYLSVNLTEVPLDLDMPPPLIYENNTIPVLYNFLMYYVPDNFEKTQVKGVCNMKSFLLNETEELKTFTGENDWPFRVKISGVDNLFNLFDEACNGLATNNGTEKPRYLVKPNFEKTRESDGNLKRHNSSAAASRRESLPFLKVKGIVGLDKNLDGKQVKQMSRSPYINHSENCYCAKTLADEVKLPFLPYLMRFDVKILYGENVLKNCSAKTDYCPFTYSPRIDSWIYFPIKVSEIPKEARIAVDVLIFSQYGESQIIGCCTKPIFNENKEMLTGVVSLNLWPFYKVEESLVCMQEFNGMTISPNSYSQLFIEFDSYITSNILWSYRDYSFIKTAYSSLDSLKKPEGHFIKLRKSQGPVACFSGIIGDDHEEEKEKEYIKKKPKVEELAALEKVLLKDPLETLTPEEQSLLFICRDHYRSIPLTLLLFLKSIDWTRPLQVKEAHRYLNLWAPMQPEDAISLLMYDYPDEYVRNYAVQRVEELSDEDFHLYMLQLVQAVTFENYHKNPLSEVILKRALRNPHQIGHYLFWTLRSQLHVKSKVERLGLLLEQFIMLCTCYREDLIKQVNFYNFYSEQSSKLSDKDSYQDREKQLRSLIESNAVRANNLCTLPVDSSIEISGPLHEKCKVMDSKKMPLWLTLMNSESGAEVIPIIFKTGDDLRQDILSLQLIRVMDMIWLENGLDLRMKPYQVISTGDQTGIIEAVTNAETTAQIHRDYGGALGALKDGTFKDFLKGHNPTDELMDKALDNFIRSSAGYCVATYILGIGDRHNGNIMITRTGHLFHIDFGHFLGNFKTALGIQRERSKFVLTEEMVFAMGGKESEGFQKFKDHCCKAYNYIRSHGKRFINLFLFMVTAGMPELGKKKEIEYLREMLSLKLTEMEADSKFLEEIETSLKNTFRRFDNLMHNFKH